MRLIRGLLEGTAPLLYRILDMDFQEFIFPDVG